jgi:hypothetical protein
MKTDAAVPAGKLVHMPSSTRPEASRGACMAHSPPALKVSFYTHLPLPGEFGRDFLRLPHPSPLPRRAQPQTPTLHLDR